MCKNLAFNFFFYFSGDGKRPEKYLARNSETNPTKSPQIHHNSRTICSVRQRTWVTRIKWRFENDSKSLIFWKNFDPEFFMKMKKKEIEPKLNLDVILILIFIALQEITQRLTKYHKSWMKNGNSISSYAAAFSASMSSLVGKEFFSMVSAFFKDPFSNLAIPDLKSSCSFSRRIAENKEF